jgi:hypothetical protein
MVRLFQTEIHLPPDSSVWVEPLERRAFSWNRMRRSISSSSHQMYPKSGSQTRLHGDSFRSDARIVAIRYCTVHEPKLLVKIFKIFNAIACARPPGPLGRGHARGHPSAEPLRLAGAARMYLESDALRRRFVLTHRYRANSFPSTAFAGTFFSV